jgi:hypothetical protein
MDALTEVEAGFAALDGEFRARKKAAEKAVSTWQWATWCWFDIKPLHFERNGFKPGRPLRQEPADRHNCVACGLDREGRVVVERQFPADSFLAGFYESFYDWSSSVVEVAHFNYHEERTYLGLRTIKNPINLVRAQLLDGRVVASDMAAIHGYIREEYRWEGGLVHEVTVQNATRKDRVLTPLRASHTARAHYDDAGVLQRVDRVWPATDVARAEGLVEIMFERRGKTIYWNSP